MYIALFFCPIFQSLDFSSLLITSSPILKFNFVINIHYCMLIKCLLEVLSSQWHSTYCSRNSIIDIWQPKSLKDKKKICFYNTDIQHFQSESIKTLLDQISDQHLHVHVITYKKHWSPYEQLEKSKWCNFSTDNTPYFQ